MIPGSVGTDVIPVTLGDADLPNNNFGELRIVPPPPPPTAPAATHAAAEARTAWCRAASRASSISTPTTTASWKAREFGIANVTVTLTGTDDLGQSVILVTMTAANGSYSFTNLRPGSYTITETQPTAFITGKDTIGSLGGITRRNQFSEITVPAGVAGVQYNFGELSRKACKLNHFNFNAARGRPLPARPGPKIRFFLPDLVPPGQGADGTLGGRRG